MDKKIDYYEDIQLFQSNVILAWIVAFLVFLFTLPLYISNYYIYLLNIIMVHSILVIGLNILVGNTEQISLGHAGFFAIGAYSAVMLMIHLNIPFLLALPLSGIITAFFGFIFGLPSLRLEGAELLNKYLLKHAKRNGFTNGKDVNMDTTVQEAGISYPTEINLMKKFQERTIMIIEKVVGTVGAKVEEINELGIEAKKKIGIQPKGQAEWEVDRETARELYCRRAGIEPRIGIAGRLGLKKSRMKTDDGDIISGQRAAIGFNLKKLMTCWSS